jgi:RNA polymerase sigma-70 factor (ECF subfamily)
VYHDYLLALAEQGNVEAFWALTEQHLGMVFNKIWFLTGSAEETRRMMKSGLTRAWLQVQLRRGLPSFPAFLSRTMMETAMKQLHRPARQEPLSSLDSELEAEDSRLIDWFHRLRPLQRRVVILRYFESLTLKEIASTLAKSDERVASALMEALDSFEIP